jgi:hypothetical protein
MKEHFLPIALALFVSACEHPIEIIGKGDVLSKTGERDCTLEDFQAKKENCTSNPVAGDYDETYYATARPGSHFNGWGNYCVPKGRSSPECSFQVSGEIVDEHHGETMPPLQAFFRKNITQGYSGLYIGHSFFNPIVGPSAVFAEGAGYLDHEYRHVPSGGPDGAPVKYWESTHPHNAEVKSIIDAGGLTLFAMTYYPFNDFEYAHSGYENWVSYTLQKNPGTSFFIALPWDQNPESVTTEEYEVRWENDYHPEVHRHIDRLRSDHPATNFYCIPDGRGAIALRKLFDMDQLPGVDVLNQEHGSVGIYADILGHPGDILVELSALLWLGAVYGVDLSSFDYQTLPAVGFTTDFPEINLARIAQRVLNQHDHFYDSK